MGLHVARDAHQLSPQTGNSKKEAPDITSDGMEITQLLRRLKLCSNTNTVVQIKGIVRPGEENSLVSHNSPYRDQRE